MPSDRLWSDTDRELVAQAIAARTRYSLHGQQCPVWKGRPCSGSDRAPTLPELARCDCWVVPGARRDAEAVLDALTAAGWRPVPEGWRVQADSDGLMTLQCLTCFDEYDLDVRTEDLTLLRMVGLAQGHEHRGGSDNGV